MKFFLSLTISTLFSVFSVFAGNSDVKPYNIKIGDVYVKVTKINEYQVSFQRCYWKLIDEKCTYLGNKKNYYIEDLESQKINESLQVGLTVVADAATLAAGACAGALGYIYFALGETAISTIIGVGLYSTAAGSVVAIPLVDALNPEVQIYQARSLRDDIIRGREVKVKKIDKFISTLDKVLKKIN